MKPLSIGHRPPLALFIAALALFATASPGQKKVTAMAAPAAPVGALAIDRSNGFVYGWANDQPNVGAAEARALAECNRRKGTCSVVLEWSGAGCAAYRTIDGEVGTAYGWGVAGTKEDADAIATREALKRSGGAQPTKFVWGCNSKTKAELVVLLDASNEPLPVPQEPHTGDVHGLALTRNGRILATAGTDGTVKLWDVASRKGLGTLKASTYAYWVAFSADGTRLAACAGKSTVHIWDVASAKEIQKIDAQTNRLTGFAFSPDGQRVITGGEYDKMLKVWNVSDGRLVREAEVAQYSVSNLAFAAGGKQLAWSGPLSAVVLADAETLEVATTFKLPIPSTGAVGVSGLAFSPDEKRIAIALYTEKVVLYDVATGNELSRFEVAPMPLTSLHFLPDGNTLVSAWSIRQPAQVWSISDGKLVKTFGRDIRRLVGTPDGSMIITLGEDNKIRFWSTKNWAELTEVDSTPPADLSEDNRPPETIQDRATRERAEAQSRKAEAARVEEERKAAEAAAKEQARLKQEEERLRVETEKKEAERKAVIANDAWKKLADARKSLEEVRKPQKKCMTKESRGTTTEWGGTKEEATLKLKKWAARMCGGKPAELTNVRCDPTIQWGTCDGDYYCPPRPTTCTAGVVKQ